MPKYRIAWLPGDGVGGEVLQAARIVLDRLGLDAEYLGRATLAGNSGARKAIPFPAAP